MTVIFRTDDGSALNVRGYLSLYNTLSVPMPERGGMREMIAPGAFDAALLRGEFFRVPVRAWHIPHATLATPRDSISVWSDRRGIAFEVTNIAATAPAARLVALIAAGELCGCSFKAKLHGGVETVGGERLFVVRKVDDVEEFSLTHSFGGCYVEAGAWIGNHAIDDLAPHFRDLARTWEAGRSTPRTAPKPRSSSAPAAVVFNRAMPRDPRPSDGFLAGMRPELAQALCDLARSTRRALG